MARPSRCWNTDAGGTIILSDALFYAQRYQPAAIVELSTLTGAIIIALGSHATGMMATEQALADRIRRPGETSGERVWQPPLWDEFREMVKSEIADLKNPAGRPPARSRWPARFWLPSWAIILRSLDIAGTAWADKPAKSYHSHGGTGVGSPSLVEYVKGLDVGSNEVNMAAEAKLPIRSRRPQTVNPLHGQTVGCRRADRQQSPHPVLMFSYLIVGVILLSAILALLNVSVTEEIAVPCRCRRPRLSTRISLSIRCQGPVTRISISRSRNKPYPSKVLSIDGIRFLFTSPLLSTSRDLVRWPSRLLP